MNENNMWRGVCNQHVGVEIVLEIHKYTNLIPLDGCSGIVGGIAVTITKHKQ